VITLLSIGVVVGAILLLWSMSEIYDLKEWTRFHCRQHEEKCSAHNDNKGEAE